LLFAAGKRDSAGSEPIAVADRTYARALFEAAQERGRLDAVHGELTDFVAAVREVPELRNVLRNPEVDPETKAGLLDEILGGADELVRNFLRLTAEKGRIGEIEDIARELDRLVSQLEKRLTVELTTAYELSDQEASGILKTIEEASGRKVDATRKVDADIIGGLILQAGSLRVDASVRGRIERLRRELVSSQ
jgi:F-type H+-transporting ATPase subunit delta